MDQIFPKKVISGLKQKRKHRYWIQHIQVNPQSSTEYLWHFVYFSIVSINHKDYYDQKLNAKSASLKQWIKNQEKKETRFKANSLSLNISKTQYSLFHSIRKRKDIPNILP